MVIHGGPGSGVRGGAGVPVPLVVVGPLPSPVACEGAEAGVDPAAGLTVGGPSSSSPSLARLRGGADGAPPSPLPASGWGAVGGWTVGCRKGAGGSSAERAGVPVSGSVASGGARPGGAAGSQSGASAPPLAPAAPVGDRAEDGGIVAHPPPSPSRVFKCRFCDYHARQKRTLVKHEDTHIGARKYACNFCPQAFNRRDDKARHERMHTGAKPYACSFCEYRAARKDTLLDHERTHTGEQRHRGPGAGGQGGGSGGLGPSEEYGAEAEA